MTSSDNKLKILVFGETQDTDAFVTKLVALNASKAGPFHAAFLLGTCPNVDLLLQQDSDSSLPLPVYLHDDGRIATLDDDEDAKKKAAVAVAVAKETEDAKAEAPPQVVQLSENLYVLRDALVKSGDGDSGGGIWSLKISPKLPELVVAVCPRGFRVDTTERSTSTTTDNNNNLLLSKLSHVSYRGCDLLLTYEPPQGAEQVLVSQQQQSTSHLVSWDVAAVALQARARYHVFCSEVYEQSQPFSHLSSTTSTAELLHVGRLIAIAPLVSAGTNSTTAAAASKLDKKRLKSVHALALTPLHAMSTAELQQQRPSAGLRPCPYTDASYTTTTSAPGGSRNTINSSARTTTTTRVAGLSQASARRILQEEQLKTADPQSQRWAAVNKKRPRPNKETRNQNDDTTTPVDHSNSTTLFVHGLHKDTSGQLQSSQGKVLLLQALKGATRVRQPPNNNSFAFVEFATHEQAAACLGGGGGGDEMEGEIIVNNVELTLKWATDGGSGNKRQNTGSIKPVRLTEEQAKDSSTVYYKWAVARIGGGDGEQKPQVEEDETKAAETGEALRQWMEATLERALNDDNADGEDRVTAASEPALCVQARVLGKFGFLEFASHAAASMALATCTGSTNGGAVLSENRPEPLHGLPLYLNWAHKNAKTQQDAEKDVIEDAASGFTFARRHFARDSRTDCWFCLASPTCEKHLLTGVYDQCYVALPKGPTHKGHVLLVPVQHVSRGALTLPDVSKEMELLKAQLRRHADAEYDCDLFVFERAMATKGGYHTHVQCIPVPRKLGLHLQTTLLKQATKAGMDIREINSDVGLSSILNNNDDEAEENGYFYAEIPVAGFNYQRFLYKASSSLSTSARVPLQFGREVLAAVLEKPELAHWKSCVVDQKQEETLATSFRESFSKFESPS